MRADAIVSERISQSFGITKSVLHREYDAVARQVWCQWCAGFTCRPGLYQHNNDITALHILRIG